MLTEQDMILIPQWDGTHRARPLLILFNPGTAQHVRPLREQRGVGMAPIQQVTQRSPLQHGSSPLRVLFNDRFLQILIHHSWCSRAQLYLLRDRLLDHLRPNRVTETGRVAPLLYRKFLAGGQRLSFDDLTVTNGDSDITSLTGMFIHMGGLKPDHSIFIDDVKYTIATVHTDYSLTLTTPYAGATATNVPFYYSQGWPVRELEIVTDEGPNFAWDITASDTVAEAGWNEAIRFRAHNPFWQGEPQRQEWNIGAFGDLVFDGEGAWFGEGGRWLFADTAVGDPIQATYWGTQMAKPIIRITGPAFNPAVINQTLDITISLDYEVAPGETVIIDTQNLSVVNDSGVNLSSTLTGPLSLFGISPDPVDRINILIVAFGDASPDSVATIEWRNQYVGI